ncbi:hypothetical protein D3C73_1317090 [compost metagenome]
MVGALEERIGILLGEITHFADRGVFLQDDLSIPIDKDLQRITFPNAQGPANFLRNNDTAQIVNTANNSSCFHARVAPLSSDDKNTGYKCKL